ncbi:RNA polymerase sigma-70 factor, TIGR02957 family [Saccharomonospora marina XMU15]|uniref:RNA polymerase sigma-70 factor, TIGR02957 family n=1 Tax=Saccharomonospora marina XMU15 TaxID=882083 RepID=H5X2G4_9PSEU|nr:RNA polymerase sigma-70 factor [Saccharomonospora marina]EHR49829.1 RNA polymerase sigma-70 factor, TIGR02957 family [Saccharomonospora marina XMU15]
MATGPEQWRVFEDARPRLFALAYRLLGSASDAEDAVQDTALRFHAADREALRTPQAWLTRVLTNVCLNRLTSARSRRERYVGPWLPEPVDTTRADLGPLENAAQRESVSMAVLVLLERLTPPERAVFVLREAFGYSHREIAELLRLSETNCQQLYHRARGHVTAGRARFAASAEHGQQLARRFLAAARGGDIDALRELLAADVVVWADGGGMASAARRPVRGAERVARYLSWMSREQPGLRVVVTELNGQPGLVAVVEEHVLLAVVLEPGPDRITGIKIVANPDKLAFLSTQLL